MRRGGRHDARAARARPPKPPTQIARDQPRSAGIRRALSRVRETVRLPCAVASRQHPRDLGSISARSRLHLGSLSALSLGSTSAPPRLYFGSISARSRLYLGSISALSQLYLASRPSELCGQLPAGRRPEPQGSAGEGGGGGTLERRAGPRSGISPCISPISRCAMGGMALCP